MSRHSSILVSIILILSVVTLAEPVFAIVPRVEKVVPYDVGSSTYLNITVYHYPEEDTTPHYVKFIKVTMGSNITQITIGLQPISPPYNNFTIQYDLGPVSGNPTINVDAYCTVHFWASTLEQNWIGQIPEFPLPALLLTLVLATSAIVLVARKTKSAK